VGLGTGVVLHVVAPWRLSWPAWVGQAAGWLLILAGVGLGVWAVRATAAVDLQRPDRLIRRGPYSFSRNPMYVAWTLGYLGVALVAGAVWLLVLLPAVAAATQVGVVREERALERRFGDAYRRYRASVRRYL
jgi:protein-S-isoprenylcysteine O-methyltransferase Ste14